jgi:hypothetical protein
MILLAVVDGIGFLSDLADALEGRIIKEIMLADK